MQPSASLRSPRACRRSAAHRRPCCRRPPSPLQVTGESSWQRPEGFTGDVGKASSNPVPVSTEKVPGTEWQEVTCDDGKKYW